MRLSSRPLLDTKADAALFVNRETELARVRRSLDADLNCLVLGRRGSGRSSFLRNLAFHMRTEWSWQHVFIEGALIDDARGFLSLLQYRLLGDQHITAAEALARTAEAGGRVLTGGVRFSLGAPKQETEELLALYAQTRSAADRKPGCVVLVDETASAALSHTIFGRFRDETWQLPLRWVVAGDANARATYLAPPADAFFETVVELPPLDGRTARQLLRKRLDDTPISREQIDTIIRLAEGHPQRLLALTRRLLVDGVSLRDLAKVHDWRSARLAELGPAAERLLEDLERYGPASASDSDLLVRLQWSRGRASQVFKQLEESGLVRGSIRRSPGGADRRVFEPVEVRP